MQLVSKRDQAPDDRTDWQKLVDLIDDFQRETTVRSVNYPTVTLPDMMQAIVATRLNGHVKLEYRNGIVSEFLFPVYIRVRIK